MLTKFEKIRYGCQLRLPNFGEITQIKLKNARVLIVGVGGLGCPAAQYLVAAGVGRVTLADFDVVSASNLHRQILFTPAEIGQKKATVAAQKLSAQNPEVNISTFLYKISRENITEIFEKHDLILDCSDNFETKYLINDAAVLGKKTVVYAAIYQFEGQLALWNAPNLDGSRSPNLRDLWPSVAASEVPDCVEGGVISPLAGIMGCLQANEAIKFLADFSENLSGKLLTFDALNLEMRAFFIGAKTKVLVDKLPGVARATTIFF